MNEKEATLLIMTKMALSDGTVTEDERDFMANFLPPDHSFDDLIAQAQNTEISTIAKTVKRYADRFFIVLRAACMAHIDLDYHENEEKMYQELVQHFEIAEDDLGLIQSYLENMYSEEQEDTLTPRFQELFEASSFAQSA